MESNIYYCWTTVRFFFFSAPDKCSLPLPAYYRSTGVFSFHVSQFITRFVFVSDIQARFFNTFCLPNTRHVSRSFLPPWSDHPKTISWGKVSLISSLLNLLQSADPSCMIVTNTLLNIPLYYTICLCPTLNILSQVHIIFTFLDINEHFPSLSFMGIPN
jgi:hypothetical protein